MNIKEDRDSTKVFPFPNDTFHSLTVYKPSTSPLDWPEAMITWGTLGPVTVEQAEAYARGILEACRLGREYNK